MFELDKDKAKIFLTQNNIYDSQIVKVAGDASFRSYYRIFNGDKKYILMYAPVDYEDINPFIKIDKFLVENNFSAPKIFAIDEKNGFILLEDFGDDTYSKVLRANNNSTNLEFELYKKSCDCLIELHKIKAPEDIAPYNNALLFKEVMLLIDWYLPSKKMNISEKEKSDFKYLWFRLFDLLSKENQVLVLRDFHADNLMILPARNDFKQVGLLDFQDAVVGSKAYDLVSLLEDARRDIDENNRQKLFDYYLKNSLCDANSFSTDYEILSLQRNIKIIGIFSRLSMRDGKHHYLNLLPRVIDFVVARLNSSNPIFSDISILLKKFI